MSDQEEEIKPDQDCSHAHVEQLLLKTFRFLMAHNGSGKMEVNVKLLKRGQKEVVIQCGRAYRFVVDSDVEQKG